MLTAEGVANAAGGQEEANAAEVEGKANAAGGRREGEENQEEPEEEDRDAEAQDDQQAALCPEADELVVLRSVCNHKQSQSISQQILRNHKQL